MQGWLRALLFCQSYSAFTPSFCQFLFLQHVWTSSVVKWQFVRLQSGRERIVSRQSAVSSEFLMQDLLRAHLFCQSAFTSSFCQLLFFFQLVRTTLRGQAVRRSPKERERGHRSPLSPVESRQ